MVVVSLCMCGDWRQCVWCRASAGGACCQVLSSWRVPPSATVPCFFPACCSLLTRRGWRLSRCLAGRWAPRALSCSVAHRGPLCPWTGAGLILLTDFRRPNAMLCYAVLFCAVICSVLCTVYCAVLQFKDDPGGLALKHEHKGLLSMVRPGAGTGATTFLCDCGCSSRGGTGATAGRAVDQAAGVLRCRHLPSVAVSVSSRRLHGGCERAPAAALRIASCPPPLCVCVCAGQHGPRHQHRPLQHHDGTCPPPGRLLHHLWWVPPGLLCWLELPHHKQAPTLTPRLSAPLPLPLIATPCRPGSVWF